MPTHLERLRSYTDWSSHRMPVLRQLQCNPSLQRAAKRKILCNADWLLVKAGIIKSCSDDRRSHSNLAAYSSLLLAERSGRWEEMVNVFFALLHHDDEHKAFGHISEPFTRQIYGGDHVDLFGENLTRRDCQEIRRLGGVPECVVAYVKGRPYRGARIDGHTLVNGPRDLDCWLNYYQLTLSCGLPLPIDYWPFGLYDTLYFDGSQYRYTAASLPYLEAWAELRRVGYSQFLSAAPNQCLERMIYRAMALAHQAGKLTKALFELSDEQAFYALGEINLRAVRRLYSLAVVGQFYSIVADYEIPVGTVLLDTFIASTDSSTALTDVACRALRLRPEQLSLCVIRETSHKAIGPSDFADGTIWSWPYPPVNRVQAYLDPQVAESAYHVAALREFLLDWLTTVGVTSCYRRI